MTRCLSVPRILFSAPNSGCGKTTIVCAVLQAFQRQGLKPAAFKCGPDYIDPLFHERVLQSSAHNLDLFLMGRGDIGKKRVNYLLADNSRQADIAIIEGAMGYYDGIGVTSENSAYDIAAATDTPVILVVDGQGAGLSVAAQLRSFASFRERSHIVGFIVNKVKSGVYHYFKDVWEQESRLKAFGYFPCLPDISLPHRHLGLVTAGEIASLQEIMDKLAVQACRSLDMEAIAAAGRTASPAVYDEPDMIPVGTACIAVAKDRAFCFYYADSLKLLERLGARLVYFSPLDDKTLPDCDGLYIGGGYPELYGKELEINKSMRESVVHKLMQGMPCIAECGGFMYLMRQCAYKGRRFAWAGFLPGETWMTDSLTRFGYVTLTAQTDTMLCRAGESIGAHEFHYSDSSINGSAFVAMKASGNRSWPCIYAAGNVVAGYPHIHFWGNPAWARRFIESCRQYRKRTIEMQIMT